MFGMQVQHPFPDPSSVHTTAAGAAAAGVHAAGLFFSKVSSRLIYYGIPLYR